MKFNISQRQKSCLAVFLLFVFTVGIFGFSFQYRDVDVETFQRDGEAGYIVLMRAKNWYNEGPVALKFALYNEIRTIEDKDVFTKENLYGSFLPGQIIPIYLVSRWLDEPPTVSMLVVINLTFHFLTAFVLSLISFFFLRQLKFRLTSAFCFSLIPVCLIIFLPGPFALHHISYTNEHLSVLPFALFILLEIIIDGATGKKGQRIAKAIQGVILFGGILISWFFVFVALTAYGKRIIWHQFENSRRSRFYFWLPVIIGVLLFLVQQFLLFGDFNDVSGYESFRALLDMFLNRTGLTGSGSAQYIQTALDQTGATSTLVRTILRPFAFLYYFYVHYVQLYGLWGFLLSVVSFCMTIIVVAIALVGKYQERPSLSIETEKILSLVYLLILPPLIWAVVFRQQISLHEYELLKAGLFVALAPFVLIPVLIYSLLYSKAKRVCDRLLSSRWHIISIATLFFLSLLYVTHATHNTPPLFSKPPQIRHDIQRFVLDNTTFEDIVFTTIYADTHTVKAGNFDVTLFGPTNKRLYEIYRPGDIYRIIKNIEARYTINILTTNTPEGESNSKLAELLSFMPHETIYGDKLTLYKIKKETFLSMENKWLGEPDELIMNGDFDTSVIGWSTWPKVSLETVAVGLTGQTLKIKLESTSSSGTYQAVSVMPGKSYTITFYQKDGNSNSTYCFGSTLAGQEIKPCEDISNVVWTKYSYTFTAASEKVYIQFYTRFNNAAHDYSYVDEVSLTEAATR